VNFSTRVGSGIGPLTVAPVDFTALTILSAELSTKEWSKDFNLILIFCDIWFNYFLV
jgi:hypothetical protein